jgi:hypothetical protein
MMGSEAKRKGKKKGKEKRKKTTHIRLNSTAPTLSTSTTEDGHTSASLAADTYVLVGTGASMTIRTYLEARVVLLYMDLCRLGMSPRLITTLDVETPSFLLLLPKGPSNVGMRGEEKISRLRPEAMGKEEIGTG